MTKPTHEEVARRAYELYLSRGAEHGLDVDDWLQAEMQMTPTTQLSVKRPAGSASGRRSARS